jgi:glycosyltransferase involved in cell wall biosynthesis
MKIALLINSAVQPRADNDTGSTAGAEAALKPALDYYRIFDGMRAWGAKVDLIDHTSVAKSRDPRVRIALGTVGPNAAVALDALLRRKSYDAVFAIGESLSIPLAMLLKGVRSRPGLATIGHRLTAPKKQVLLKLSRGMVDQVLTYSPIQRKHAIDAWGVPQQGVNLIPYCTDTDFFRPEEGSNVHNGQICSVGSEWRDQKTLLRVVAEMPDITLKMTSYSPWTRRVQTVLSHELPCNAEVGRYEYIDLRRLYASSMFCVVPLRNTDFAAGITAILEGMAMGKPVISTATAGMHPGIIQDGESGLLVPPNDPNALALAIRRLRNDHDLCVRMGLNARRWVELNATLDHWVTSIAEAIHASCGRRLPVIDRQRHAESGSMAIKRVWR